MSVTHGRVFKYVLSDPESAVMMPVGAEILTVGVQGSEVMIWALVDPDLRHEERRFLVAGTGHPIEWLRRGRFLGTVFVGPLVFHVWEEHRAND